MNKNMALRDRWSGLLKEEGSVICRRCILSYEREGKVSFGRYLPFFKHSANFSTVITQAKGFGKQPQQFPREDSRRKTSDILNLDELDNLQDVQGAEPKAFKQATDEKKSKIIELDVDEDALDEDEELLEEALEALFSKLAEDLGEVDTGHYGDDISDDEIQKLEEALDQALVNAMNAGSNNELVDDEDTEEEFDYEAVAVIENEGEIVSQSFSGLSLKAEQLEAIKHIPPMVGSVEKARISSGALTDDEGNKSETLGHAFEINGSAQETLLSQGQYEQMQNSEYSTEHTTGIESEEDEEDDEDELPRTVRLKMWQVNKLQNALDKHGRRHINVKALAAETKLDRNDVLAWLRIASASSDRSASSLASASPSATSLPAAPVVQSGPAPVALPLEAGPVAMPPMDLIGKRNEPAGGRRGFVGQKRIKKEHLATLEQVYRRSHYPTGAMISNLVMLTNLPKKRIEAWFVERRERTGENKQQQQQMQQQKHLQ
eukprot:TRINITY_DN7294_c0_g1_i2.p1 TRINITY_DN7294_c0_g1~~TRINITY_DN7294_c0_g1_i2.p1  ORF type:complete len:490 (+),score=117.16 TRINITY_DN7294_c0_g1_i2:243-1712(+)